MVTYDPNIPQPNDFPSDSQAELLANFQYLIPSSASTTGLSRDHFMTLGSTNTGDGAHRWVTFRANQATPGFAAGVGVLYTNLANGQSQLFYNNGGGNVQLTSAIASVPSFVAGPPILGASFLPGGMLIQWGTDSKSTGQSTTLAVAFSSTNYIVMLTPNIPTAIGNGVLNVGVKQVGSFQIGNTSGGLQIYNYNWIAIGPA